jgi:hypothetical protein
VPGALARPGGAGVQAGQHERQAHLEDRVVVDRRQVLADLPDGRVLGPVGGQVGGRPGVLVVLLQLLVHGQGRRLGAGPVQAEVADRAVDHGGLRALEAGREHTADDDVDCLHLGRTLGNSVGRQRRRGRMGEVGLPNLPGGVGQRVDPAVAELHVARGLLDQVIGHRQHQVVLAGEVPVDGGRVSAEGAAELGQTEAGDPLGVKQPQALAHDQLAGEVAALQPAPPAGPRPRRVRHRAPFPFTQRAVDVARKILDLPERVSAWLQLKSSLSQP